MWSKRNRMKMRCCEGGFTLLEILIALFVMSVGIVGVLALFPVGIEASREAMDNMMVSIIGESAIDQMQIYMNVSQIFDSRPGVYKRYYTAVSTGDTSSVSFIQEGGRPPYVTENGANFAGFYLRVLSGTGAGRVALITGASGTTFNVMWTGRGLSAPALDSTSKFVVTRYGFPTTPKPVRVARVTSVGGNSVTVESVYRPGRSPEGWSGGVWGRGYYVIFTSGFARGKIYEVKGNTGSSISMETGSRSLEEDDRVRRGDTLMVLGNDDVLPTYPPNFGKTTIERRWGIRVPPIIYYYTSPRQADEDPDIVKSALYGWAAIISTADAPPGGGATGVATACASARVDIIVFKNYAMSGTNTWYPLSEQPPAIGYVTAYISPL